VLHVSVISPEASLYEGDAASVVVPAYDGELGILTGHAPLMTLLGKGEMRIEGGPGARRFAIEGGFLQIVNDQVRVVTERGSSIQG
jgi:F-type H+-transporting ATPase subunit epsilon